MKRPSAPHDCPRYQEMLRDVGEYKDELGNTRYKSGVTLEKLLTSDSDLCRAYGNSVLEFKAKAQGESKASFIARLGLIV